MAATVVGLNRVINLIYVNRSDHVRLGWPGDFYGGVCWRGEGQKLLSALVPGQKNKFRAARLAKLRASVKILHVAGTLLL